MIDRELLENAAKAAKFEYRYNDSVGGPHYIRCSTGYQEWNPLNDDGDAFRLAVELDISITVDEPILVGTFGGTDGHKFGEYERGVEAWIVDKYDASSIEVMEIYGDDKKAASRLAIVKVAAEIGKKL
jgi:hypothetical protein